MIESHFLTLSAHLFLSVSVFRLFTFPVITDMLGLRSALLVVSSLSSQFLFLWFLFSSFVLLENLEPHFYLYAVFLSIYLFVQFLVVVVHITQHMSQLSQSTGVIFCQFKRTIETFPTLYAFYPPRLIIVLNVSFTCFKITSNSVIIFAPNVILQMQITVFFKIKEQSISIVLFHLRPFLVLLHACAFSKERGNHLILWFIL